MRQTAFTYRERLCTVGTRLPAPAGAIGIDGAVAAVSDCAACIAVAFVTVAAISTG